MIIIFNSEIIFLIVLLGISITISIISAAIYKNEEKVDKGFVFNYHKLSYRRKWIRTLWTIPFIVICLFIIYQLGDWQPFIFTLISSLCGAMLVGDFFYNFFKWKKYEQDPFKEDL